MKLIFDTETTGLVDFTLPFNKQVSRMVSLAFIVIDDNNDVGFEYYQIIKPEGFFISERMTAIHGISQEKALKEGILVKGVLNLFIESAKICDTFIGHNIKFDRCIIASELERYGIKYPDKEEFCTMLELTNICKIPKKSGRGNKWPKLTEAHKFFFGTEAQEQHNALGDCRTTQKIYKAYINSLAKSTVNITELNDKIAMTNRINHAEAALSVVDVTTTAFGNIR